MGSDHNDSSGAGAKSMDYYIGAIISKFIHAADWASWRRENPNCNGCTCPTCGAAGFSHCAYIYAYGKLSRLSRSLQAYYNQLAQPNPGIQYSNIDGG